MWCLFCNANSKEEVQEVLSVCTCDHMYVTSQRIMLLRNVISSWTPNCGMLCWRIFQRPGQPCGCLPWYGTRHFAPLKKRHWITYQCNKVCFTDTFGMWFFNELFCAEATFSTEASVPYKVSTGGGFLWLFKMFMLHKVALTSESPIKYWPPVEV